MNGSCGNNAQIINKKASSGSFFYLLNEKITKEILK